MTVATLSVLSSDPTTAEADVLVVGVVKGADGPEATLEVAGLSDSFAALGGTGARDELAPGRRAGPRLCRGRVAGVGYHD